MNTDPANEVVDLLRYLNSLPHKPHDTLFDVIDEALNSTEIALFSITSEVVLKRLDSLSRITMTLLDGHSALPEENIGNAISRIDGISEAFRNPTTKWQIFKQGQLTQANLLAIGALVPDFRTKLPLPVFSEEERVKFTEKLTNIRDEVLQGDLDWFDDVLLNGLERLRASIENFHFFGVHGVCAEANSIAQNILTIESEDASITAIKTSTILKDLYKILIIPPALLAALTFYGDGVLWTIKHFSNNSEEIPKIEFIIPKRIEGPSTKEEE